MSKGKASELGKMPGQSSRLYPRSQYSQKDVQDALEKIKTLVRLEFPLDRPIFSPESFNVTELGCQFIKDGIGILARGLSIYGELFRRSGYENRQALEQAIGSHSRAVKEAAQDLMDVESELTAAGCQVVVVTFGQMAGAVQWLKETKCPFPYYTNSFRTIYKDLGLKRSIQCVWNPATLSYYGEKLAKQEPLPMGYSNIEDDPHQMGGDFIFDVQGKLTFVYRSKMPSDRPSVDLILEALGSKTSNL